MASTAQTFPASTPATATGSTQRKPLNKASWPTDVHNLSLENPEIAEAKSREDFANQIANETQAERESRVKRLGEFLSGMGGHYGLPIPAISLPGATSGGKASWPTSTTASQNPDKTPINYAPEYVPFNASADAGQPFGTMSPVTTPEGDILPPQQAVFTPDFAPGAGKISAAPSRDELLKSAIDMKDAGLDQQIFARAKTNMDIQRQQELQAIDSDLAKRGIYNSGIGVRARVLANAKSDEQLKDLSAQFAIAETARNRDDAMKSIQMNMDAWKQQQVGEMGVANVGLETAAAQRAAAGQELQGTLNIQQIQSAIQDNETRTALLMDQAQQAMIMGNIELANQLAGMAQASTDATNSWRAQALQAQNAAAGNQALYGGLGQLGGTVGGIGLQGMMNQQTQQNQVSAAQKRLDELNTRPGPGLS